MSTLTTDQWTIIAIIFVAGLLLGFVLRSGGSKWRRKYELEHTAHATLRREYDAHLARHNEARPVERETLRAGSF
jgi:uncharacterized membrane-anchored protein YhcB (DUF1043 family)